jgi:hypothetical protein
MNYIKEKIHFILTRFNGKGNARKFQAFFEKFQDFFEKNQDIRNTAKNTGKISWRVRKL